MTQIREQAAKIAEFNALFLALDESRQENALYILRALDFAQDIMPVIEN